MGTMLSEKGLAGKNVKGGRGCKKGAVIFLRNCSCDQGQKSYSNRRGQIHWNFEKEKGGAVGNVSQWGQQGASRLSESDLSYRGEKRNYHKKNELKKKKKNEKKGKRSCSNGRTQQTRLSEERFLNKIQ